MAIPLDKDRLLSDCRDEDLQSDMTGVEGICYERTIGYRYSDDKRYLIITKEQVIDLYAVNRLGKRDQYEQQALYIYGIFARYLDAIHCFYTDKTAAHFCAAACQSDHITLRRYSMFKSLLMVDHLCGVAV